MCIIIFESHVFVVYVCFKCIFSHNVLRWNFNQKLVNSSQMSDPSIVPVPAGFIRSDANSMKTFPSVEVFIMAVDLTFHYNLIALVANCLGFPDERWINWLQWNIIPKEDKPFKALSLFLKQVRFFDKWFNDFSMDLNFAWSSSHTVNVKQIKTVHI